MAKRPGGMLDRIAHSDFVMPGILKEVIIAMVARLASSGNRTNRTRNSIVALLVKVYWSTTKAFQFASKLQ
jgi:hypothetical protein